MPTSSERIQQALSFDRAQAEKIAAFLTEQIDEGAEHFRLMPDSFSWALDLTSYDALGAEITHIHPSKNIEKR